jgi:hypothetical protein
LTLVGPLAVVEDELRDIVAEISKPRGTRSWQRLR